MIALAVPLVAALRAKRGAASPSAATRITKDTLGIHPRTRSWETRIIDSDAITVERRGWPGPGCAIGFVRHESLRAKRLRHASPPWQLPCVRAPAQDAHGTALRPAHRRRPRAREFLSGPARTSPSVAFAVWTQPRIPPRCISLPEANSYARERKLVPRPVTPRRALLPASTRS